MISFLPMDHSEGFLALVLAVKKHIKEEDIPTVQKRLASPDKPVLIDVREDSEWARGHVPGAIHLGRGVIERDIERTIPDKSTNLVLYCGGGFRSALAAENLQKMGYRNVISMDGGWRGWTEAGLPVIID
jgi:rhodanese-related sulfurtransferase